MLKNAAKTLKNSQKITKTAQNASKIVYFDQFCDRFDVK
jgi:hypothetical protein